MPAVSEHVIQIVGIEVRTKKTPDRQPLVVVCAASLEEGVSAYYRAHPGVLKESVRKLGEVNVDFDVFVRALKAQTALDHARDSSNVRDSQHDQAFKDWGDMRKTFSQALGHEVNLFWSVLDPDDP